MNNSLVTRQQRIRYNPTWHVLGADDSLILAVNESNFTAKNIVITPDLSRSNQIKIALEMGEGETVYCKLLNPGYSVTPGDYTTYRLMRVS